jgi:hypothetical protein
VKLYGSLDLLFAALYAYLGFGLGHGRSLAFNLSLGLVCALLVVAGVGLLAGTRWSRPVAIVASALLLVFAAATVTLMVMSAAYLRGVYGTLGQGMATVSLAVAALVIELFALLPLFQLRFLLQRVGQVGQVGQTRA